MVFLYVPGAAGSNAGSSLHLKTLTDASVTWNGKPLPPRTLSSRWRRVPWLRRLSGMTLNPSTADAGVGSFISSLRVTPASRSAWPGEEVDAAILGICGPRWPASSAKLNRISCFSRTCPATSPSDSTRSPGALKAWATRLRLASSRRRKWARATSGSGCSSSAWPTATAGDGQSSRNLTSGRSDPNSQHHSGTTLTDAAILWPTASARDWKDGHASPKTHARNSRPLNEVAVLWATPTTSDQNIFGATTDERIRANGTSLNDQAMTFPSSLPAPPTSTDGEKSCPSTPGSPRLNPAMVCWLMGWPPIGPGGSACSGTAWSRYRRLMRSALSGLLCGPESGSWSSGNRSCSDRESPAN